MGGIAGALGLCAARRGHIPSGLCHFQEELDGARDEAFEHIAERRWAAGIFREGEHRVPEADLAAALLGIEPLDRELAPAALRQALEVMSERRLGGEAMGLRLGMAPEDGGLLGRFSQDRTIGG